MASPHRHPSQPEHHTAIVRFLRERLDGLVAVYLFGSRASGQETAGSDFDIAVLADKPLGTRQQFELAQALADRLGCDVDLIDLHSASTVLRSQIIGHGRALYLEPIPELEAFQDFVFSDYARLNEERAGILQDIESRGSIHG